MATLVAIGQIWGQILSRFVKRLNFKNFNKIISLAYVLLLFTNTFCCLQIFFAVYKYLLLRTKTILGKIRLMLG